MQQIKYFNAIIEGMSTDLEKRHHNYIYHTFNSVYIKKVIINLINK